MRNLLIPITGIIWFCIVLIMEYCLLFLVLWIFNFSWYSLIFSGGLLAFTFLFLINLIPMAINALMLLFYKVNWISVITHSVLGLLAIVYFYFIMLSDPPQAFSDNGNATNLISAMWEKSWGKTLFVMIDFIFVQLMFIYQIGLGSIQLKLETENNK